MRPENKKSVESILTSTAFVMRFALLPARAPPPLRSELWARVFIPNARVHHQHAPSWILHAADGVSNDKRPLAQPPSPSVLSGDASPLFGLARVERRRRRQINYYSPTRARGVTIFAAPTWLHAILATAFSSGFSVELFDFVSFLLFSLPLSFY